MKKIRKFEFSIYASGHSLLV